MCHQVSKFALNEINIELGFNLGTTSFNIKHRTTWQLLINYYQTFANIHEYAPTSLCPRIGADWNWHGPFMQ